MLLKVSASVYLIRAQAPLPADAPPDAGVFKIGISRHVSGRLATLRTASPYPLRLERSIKFPTVSSAFRVEARAHAILGPCRACGEWFIGDAVAVSVSLDTAISFEVVSLFGTRGAVDWLTAAGMSEDAARDLIASDHEIGTAA